MLIRINVMVQLLSTHFMFAHPSVSHFFLSFQKHVRVICSVKKLIIQFQHQSDEQINALFSACDVDKKCHPSFSSCCTIIRTSWHYNRKKSNVKLNKLVINQKKQQTISVQQNQNHTKPILFQMNSLSDTQV